MGVLRFRVHIFQSFDRAMGKPHIVYWGCIGIMEKNMATIGIIYGVV